MLKARAAAEMEKALAAKRAAQEAADKALEGSHELELLRAKVEYQKKEHALQLQAVEGEKAEVSEEAQRMQAKVAQLEAKLGSAENEVRQAVQQASAAADAHALATAFAEKQAAAVSAPNSPQKPAGDSEERQRRPLRMSAPPVQHHVREPSNHSHPLATISASGHSTPASSEQQQLSSEDQSQIEQLNRGLKRKCDQYIGLMLQHAAQGERVEQLEQALEETNGRLREHMATSARKIKELDEKLLAAENHVAQLWSGKHSSYSYFGKNSTFFNVCHI